MVALSPAQCCPCSAQLISHVGPNLGLLVVSSLSDANLKFHPSVPPHQMAAHLHQDTISAPHWSFISPASWMLYCCLISNDGVNLHIIGCARCGGGVAPDTSWHNWPALLTALGHALVLISSLLTLADKAVEKCSTGRKQMCDRGHTWGPAIDILLKIWIFVFIK